MELGFTVVMLMLAFAVVSVTIGVIVGTAVDWWNTRQRFPKIKQRKVYLACDPRAANSVSKRHFWKQTFGITAH